MHGPTPKVSHFHVFGCKCFILKKGRKLDKFEARSVDGIFFGYASYSKAYHVLNLETNQIVETCEVTFDETEPRSQLYRQTPANIVVATHVAHGRTTTS
jgi:hypothetical protein